MKKKDSRLRAFLFSSGFAGLCLGMVSCQAPTPTAGGSEYLAGLTPPPRGYVNTYGQDQQPGPPVDNESYWDGDGLTGSPRVTIDLSDQKAYFYKGDQLAGVSRISSGSETHRTPSGSFRVLDKRPDHRSSLYGNYVDANGAVVMKDVDTRKDKRPAGTKYAGSPMPHFMRFNGGIGMHAGFLPGYPASHGCIRMPAHMAEVFFHNLKIGTPVKVVP